MSLTMAGMIVVMISDSVATESVIRASPTVSPARGPAIRSRQPGTTGGDCCIQTSAWSRMRANASL